MRINNNENGDMGLRLNNIFNVASSSGLSSSPIT